MKSPEHYDVIIIGAGPAGLSAALILARSCRKILLCDANQPRNWASKSIHGFVGLDGINPRVLRQGAWEHMKQFPRATLCAEKVTEARRVSSGFQIVLEDGTQAQSRKLLLATGLVDTLPPIPDIDQYFGISVFQCPYCDGWERRGQAIAVYGRGADGYTMARPLGVDPNPDALYGWTESAVRRAKKRLKTKGYRRHRGRHRVV